MTVFHKNDVVRIKKDGLYKNKVGIYVSSYSDNGTNGGTGFGDCLVGIGLNVKNCSIPNKGSFTSSHVDFDDIVKLAESDLILIYSETYEFGDGKLPKFNVGDRVVITSGKYKKFKAVISEIIYPGSELKNFAYNVLICRYPIISYGSIISTTVSENDIMDINEAKAAGFNIYQNYPEDFSFEGDVMNTALNTLSGVSKYISDDEMKNIITRITEEKVSKKIDSALEARTGPCGSVVDQMIRDCCQMYAEKLSPNFEEDFLKRIQTEINREPDPNSEDDVGTNMVNYITWPLEKLIKEYVSAHKDELMQLMIKDVREKAKSMNTDALLRIIKSNIDINEILKMAFTDAGSTPNFPK